MKTAAVLIAAVGLGAVFASPANCEPRGVLDIAQDRQTFFSAGASHDPRATSEWRYYLFGDPLSVRLAQHTNGQATRYAAMIVMAPPDPMNVLEVGRVDCGSGNLTPSFRAFYLDGSLQWSGAPSEAPAMNDAQTLLSQGAVAVTHKFLCDGVAPSVSIADTTLFDLP
jgi:hypothetical protein